MVQPMTSLNDSKGLGTVLALVEIFNIVAPGIATLVTMIRHRDGTLSVLHVLDESDTQFDTNLKQAAEWLSKKPAAPTLQIERV